MQRLRELGWIEGRNVAIEYRWAEGRTERFAEIAAEFVRLKVDVIVTHGNRTQSSRQSRRHRSSRSSSLRRRTRLAIGLVASLARPGGNVTGLSNQPTDLAGKRLELLREVVPGLRRLAIMANVGNPVAVLEMGEVQAAAHTLGLEAAASKSDDAEDIAPAFERSRAARKHFMSVAEPLMNTNRVRINTLALDARLPTMHGSGVRRSGRPDVLWSKYPGPVPARRRLCRQDFARGEARRHSGRAADQVRSGHQHENC